ncbi:hypothetical protein CUU02_10795 [Klebsiella pneumoniae]|nr:hypothetical protein APT85_11595 [Klebsiella pneumoniae]PJG89983.1 hypothetical protein CUT95_08625 [Klebsiella pneumoniae]PJG95731.1 hypothetical protein CUT94_06120 [Klebsiella pneumoniae]PJG99172.1 hypothetical protein CUT93_14075 [Klebsiella pneumoniae]PJH05321.1 hypothetical protein CUU00_12820 [Klebsiella pneumoniae]
MNTAHRYAECKPDGGEAPEGKTSETKILKPEQCIQVLSGSLSLTIILVFYENCSWQIIIPKMKGYNIFMMIVNCLKHYLYLFI